jgi:hypothetical protein
VSRARILRDQYPTQRRPEARPRARSRRFTIWKALLVMITQRGFSCASVTALLSTTPVRSLAGRFFYKLGSRVDPVVEWPPPARASVVKKVHVRELAKEKTPPKRGQVVHMSAYEA